MIFIDKNQKTLVLDLDETLVYACTSSDKPDKVISLGGENGPLVLFTFFLVLNEL